MAGDSNSAASDGPSASSDGVTDSTTTTTITTRTTDSITTTSTIPYDRPKTDANANVGFTSTVTDSTTYSLSTTTDFMFIFSLTSDTNAGRPVTASDRARTSTTSDPLSITAAETSSMFDTSSDKTTSRFMTETSSMSYFTGATDDSDFPEISVNSITTFTISTTTSDAFSDSSSTAGPSADIDTSSNSALETGDGLSKPDSTAPSPTVGTYSNTIPGSSNDFMVSKFYLVTSSFDSTSDLTFSGTVNTDPVTGTVPNSVGVVPSTRVLSPATISEMTKPNDKASSGYIPATVSVPTSQVGVAPPITGADTKSVTPDISVDVLPPDVPQGTPSTGPPPPDAPLPDAPLPDVPSPDVPPEGPAFKAQDTPVEILPSDSSPSDVTPGKPSPTISVISTDVASPDIPSEVPSSKTQATSTDVPPPDTPPPDAPAPDIPSSSGERPTVPSLDAPLQGPEAPVESLSPPPGGGSDLMSETISTAIDQSNPTGDLNPVEPGQNSASNSRPVSIDDPESQREIKSSEEELPVPSGGSTSEEKKDSNQENTGEQTEKKGTKTLNWYWLKIKRVENIYC